MSTNSFHLLEKRAQRMSDAARHAEPSDAEILFKMARRRRAPQSARPRRRTSSHLAFGTLFGFFISGSALAFSWSSGLISFHHPLASSPMTEKASVPAAPGASLAEGASPPSRDLTDGQNSPTAKPAALNESEFSQATEPSLDQTLNHIPNAPRAAQHKATMTPQMRVPSSQASLSQLPPQESDEQSGSWRQVAEAIKGGDSERAQQGIQRLAQSGDLATRQAACVLQAQLEWDAQGRLDAQTKQNLENLVLTGESMAVKRGAKRLLEKDRTLVSENP